MTPQLRQLDLAEVVKILRSRIFDLLPGFTGLFTLKCGSGSGGVSDIYGHKFLSGVRNLKLLVHFSLQVRAFLNLTMKHTFCKSLPRLLKLSPSRSPCYISVQGIPIAMCNSLCLSKSLVHSLSIHLSIS